MFDFFGNFGAGREVGKQEEKLRAEREAQHNSWLASVIRADAKYVPCDKCKGNGHIHISEIGKK